MYKNNHLLTLFLTAIFAFSPLPAAAKEQDKAIKAWRDFTGALEKAGVDVLSSYPQPQSLDTAEGLRYMLQQIGASANKVLEEQTDQIPLLRVGAHTLNKWGLDGADVKYQGASIRSDSEYRFFGSLGSARLFAVQLSQHMGNYTAFGALTHKQLTTDKDGNFEVLISRSRPKDWQGNWLELVENVDSLLVREYFSDWVNERPGRYFLENLRETANSAPTSVKEAGDLLIETANTFAKRVPEWQNHVSQTRQHLVNKLHTQKTAQGLASNAYGSGWFQIEPDEALVIELERPDALLWSFQIGNVWWESIDYINHTASYNDSQAVQASDGKYYFVLSLDDPGVPNWIDPAGHTEGALLFRLQDTKTIVNPLIKRIPLTDLAEHLPKNTPKVGVEQRAAAIDQRRRHAAIRWAP